MVLGLPSFFCSLPLFRDYSFFFLQFWVGVGFQLCAMRVGAKLSFRNPLNGYPLTRKQPPVTISCSLVFEAFWCLVLPHLVNVR